MIMTPTLMFLYLLRAAAPVTALVGDRIHVEDAPAGTQGAYVIVRPSGGGRIYGLEKATGHQLARMTAIVFAPTFKDADEAAAAIEVALLDLRQTVDGTRVVIRSEGVGVSDTVDDPKRYRRAMQFDMHLSRGPPG